MLRRYSMQDQRGRGARGRDRTRLRGGLKAALKWETNGENVDGVGILFRSTAGHGRGDGGSLLHSAVFVEGDNTATTTNDDDDDDDDKDPNRPVVVVTEDHDSDGPLRRARRALADSVNNNVINRHLSQLA